MTERATEYLAVLTEKIEELTEARAVLSRERRQLMLELNRQADDPLTYAGLMRAANLCKSRVSGELKRARDEAGIAPLPPNQRSRVQK